MTERTLSLAERLANLPKADVAALMRNQSGFDRETAECDDIIASRPLGVDAIRDEPRSIHSPSPPARVRWEAPVKRGTGPRKRFAEN